MYRKETITFYIVWLERLKIYIYSVIIKLIKEYYKMLYY